MNRPTLIIGIILVFVATIAILSQIMPGPRHPTDYLVMGAAATLLCIVLLFVLLVFVPDRGSGKAKHHQDR